MHLDRYCFKALTLRTSTFQELINGHHDIAPVPGGFGASAGPNDGWHCALHALTKSFLRTMANDGLVICCVFLYRYV